MSLPKHPSSAKASTDREANTAAGGPATEPRDDLRGGRRTPGRQRTGASPRCCPSAPRTGGTRGRAPALRRPRPKPPPCRPQPAPTGGLGGPAPGRPSTAVPGPAGPRGRPCSPGTAFTHRPAPARRRRGRHPRTSAPPAGPAARPHWLPPRRGGGALRAEHAGTVAALAGGAAPSAAMSDRRPRR